MQNILHFLHNIFLLGVHLWLTFQQRKYKTNKSCIIDHITYFVAEIVFIGVLLIVVVVVVVIFAVGVLTTSAARSAVVFAAVRAAVFLFLDVDAHCGQHWPVVVFFSGQDSLGHFDETSEQESIGTPRTS